MHVEALLADNRAEIRLMIDPDAQDEAPLAAKRETEEALRIAVSNLQSHKQEHGC
jgi:hypothetical protein